MTHLRMSRVLPVAAGAMIVSLGALAAGPAGAAVRTADAAALPPTAYLAACYWDGVQAISTATNFFGDTIPAGDCPDAMAITPDHQTVYAGNSGDGTVTPIATATNTPGSPIDVGGDPGAITMAPNGETAWVTLTNNGASTALVPLKTATGTVGSPIPLSGDGGVAITPDSRTVYAADGSTGVLPINARTGKAGKPIKLGAGNDAVGVAVTPDGKTLLVTTYDPSAAAPGQGEVMAIRTATDTVRARLKVAVNLGQILIAPGGRTAYVSAAAGGPYDVYAVSTGCDMLLHSFDLGDNSADNMQITPDGKTVYAAGQVSAFDGSPWDITPVDTATQTAQPPIIFQSNQFEVFIEGVRIGGITPDGKTLYAIYRQDGLGGPSWTVDAISTGTDTVTDAIGLATMGPGEMVFTP
jgi:DNA-binding beta-propeller fold protein YncE